MSFASSPVLHGQRGPVRVLIADDHPVVRHGLKTMLDADPELQVVGEARDGDEAFEKAHQVDWDVAVLDYSMPGRGGVELLADVKHDYPDKPVLILSIYPEDPHGLQSDTCHFFKRAANGQMWLATAAGLHRMELADPTDLSSSTTTHEERH